MSKVYIWVEFVEFLKEVVDGFFFWPDYGDVIYIYIYLVRSTGLVS